VSGAIPGVSGAIPGVSGAIPDVSGAIPGVSGAIPGVSDPIPSVSAAIPSLSDVIPSVSDVNPERRVRLPVSVPGAVATGSIDSGADDLDPVATAPGSDTAISAIPLEKYRFRPHMNAVL
jgi:hypothetical protein